MEIDTYLANLMGYSSATIAQTDVAVQQLFDQITNLTIPSDFTAPESIKSVSSRVYEPNISPIAIGTSMNGSIDTHPNPVAQYKPIQLPTTSLNPYPSANWASIPVSTVTEPSVGFWPDPDTGATAPSDIPPPDTKEVELTRYNDYETYLVKDIALVESAVRNYMASYAPNYLESLEKLEQTAYAGIDDGAVMPATVEAAMVNRKRQSIDRERLGAERMALRVETARGGDVVQPAYFAALRSIAAQHSDQIANTNNEVFLWKAEIEVKHREFCMQTLNQLQSTVMSTLVGWGQLFTNYKNALLNYEAAFLNATVQAHRDKLNADVQVFNIQTEQDAKIYGLDVEKNKADITGYGTYASYQSEVLRSRTNKMQAEVTANSAEVSAAVSAYNTYTSNTVQQQSNLLDASIKKYGGDIQKDQARIEGYKAYSDAIVSKFQADVAQVGHKIQGQAAYLKALVDKGQVTVERANNEIKANIADFEGRIRVRTARAELDQKGLMAAAEAYQSAAATLGQIAAAATHILSGIAVNTSST